MTRRLELPVFAGEDADSWVIRVEQYFELGNFTETQKLQAVKVCFDKEALTWYRWERDRNPFLNWKQMKRRILEQFSASYDTITGEKLLTLHQEGSVKDYCCDFINLATQATEILEYVLELRFMIRLKPRVRAGVKMFEPRHLRKMMEVAKMVEEWNGAKEEPSGFFSRGRHKGEWVGQARNPGPSSPTAGKTNSGPNSNKPISSAVANKQAASFWDSDTRNPNHHNRLKPPFCRLTPAKIAYRKANNLCFRCDEPWHARHLCDRKELQLFVVYSDGSEQVWDGEEELVAEEVDTSKPEMAELSLNSLVGISSPRTMKLRGLVEGAKVVVMINSGATYNFISLRLAGELGLQTDRTHSYGVLTGTRVTVQGDGVCPGVDL